MKIVLNKKINFDWYRLLLVCAFTHSTILNYVEVIWSRLPYINVFSEYVVEFIIISLIIINVMEGHFVKPRKTDVVILTLFIVLISGSYVLYPSTRQYYNEYNLDLIFSQAIPFFILGVGLIIDRKTIDWLTYSSYGAIALNALYIVYYLQTRTASEDNMDLSYKMLPHVLFVIRSVFDNDFKVPRFLKILFTIVGCYFIISMGSRGPILIALCYLLIMFFVRFRGTWRGKLILVTTGGCISYWITSGMFIKSVEQLVVRLEKANLSVRALEFLLEGKYISETSSRDSIFELCWDKIINGPVFGYGFFGDWQFVGYSAHNIYLQICLYFGLIIGFILIISYILIIGRAYLVSENHYAKELVLLFAIFTLVRGIYGGECLGYHTMFLLGLCINMLREVRRSKCYIKKCLGEFLNQDVLSH